VQRVHVYVTDVADVRGTMELEGYRALLSAEERERYGRLEVEAARDEFLVGRALARHALSRHAQVPLAEWRFSVGPYGRLEPAAPAHEPRLRFSLSHAAGVVACAVAEEVAVGVDVELVDERRADEALAKRFFAPAEVRDLLALPAIERSRRFFEHWTLKEAYLKARGLGLAIPLDRFWFRLGGGAPIAVTFAPSLDDDPARWQFAQRRLFTRHLLAVAVATKGRRSRLSLSVERCVPLSTAQKSISHAASTTGTVR